MRFGAQLPLADWVTTFGRTSGGATIFFQKPHDSASKLLVIAIKFLGVEKL
jgi:hypothetical protein